MSVGRSRPPAVAVSIGIFIVLILSACSSELDDAIAQGCAGLDLMAESYPTGDRAAFDHARDMGLAFNGAVELSSTAESEVSPTSVVVIGKQGVYAYLSAAYEPVENNRGEFVWQGKPLTSKQQARITRAIAACDSR